MRYRVDFYEDIIRRSETEPCASLPRTYATEDEAEDAARSALAKIRQSHGPKAGFLVTDMNHVPVRMGPGAYEDASGP